MTETNKKPKPSVPGSFLPPFLFWFAIIVFLFSSLPNQTLEQFGGGLKDFRDTYAFILTPLTLLLICAAGLCFEGRKKRIALNKLNNLSPCEKKILAGYLAKNSLSIHIDEKDEGISGLQQFHVIKRQFFTKRGIDISDSYKIEPWLLGHLKKHPEILGEGVKTMS